MDLNQPQKTRILVTGATGYIGGRLVPLLLDQGYEVCCLVRREEKLRMRSWYPSENLTVVQGSIDDEEQLLKAMEGCQSAYYLVHSMEAAGKHYAKRDIELATAFKKCAEKAGLERMIYLGGLGELGTGLSKHLKSRREVELSLKDSTVPLTTFRAAMIIGAGSASFEILRYLIERLPVMVTPRWVQTKTQPISVDNVLRYLIDCLNVKETIGKTLDIGGPSIVTYQHLMEITAEQLKLGKRYIFPVPILTPRLSSLWIGLVTPVSTSIARPLAEGLKNETVCRTNEATLFMPQKLHTAEEAISAAIGHLKEGNIETSWSMSGEIPGDPDWAGGTSFHDDRKKRVKASAEKTFEVVCSIGGQKGYWGADFLWQLRGLLDQIIGGPGLRRGRRHPKDLKFGEAVDFWRVRQLEHPKKLTLHAEMWLPGDAELDFEIQPISDEECEVTQTARFQPRGLLGILYWYSVVPMHYFVFQFMINGIKKDAEKQND